MYLYISVFVWLQGTGCGNYWTSSQVNPQPSFSPIDSVYSCYAHCDGDVGEQKANPTTAPAILNETR